MKLQFGGIKIEEKHLDQESFLQLNAELAEVWPNITERKEPPADAEDWAGKPGKLEFLER